MEMVHISSVKDGAIVNFRNSQIPYMKICNGLSGVGGVVDIQSGEHLTMAQIFFDYGAEATVIADNIFEWMEA